MGMTFRESTARDLGRGAVSVSLHRVRGRLLPRHRSLTAVFPQLILDTRYPVPGPWSGFHREARG